jgi:hypothetical protein
VYEFLILLLDLALIGFILLVALLLLYEGVR